MGVDMRIWPQAFKGKFWPISALLFAPWNALLVFALASYLSKGTAFESYLLLQGDLIKSVLMVIFSLYFVLALMMWAVGRPRPGREAQNDIGGDKADAVIGLSPKQIVVWGLLGMVTVPVLAIISVVAQHADIVDAFNHFVGPQSAINSGFIWLISISVVIMVPTMVIWLVWMWRAWSSAKQTDEGASWGYEYD